MFTDVFEWLQGLSAVYPFIGLTVIVVALFVLFAATGARPVGRQTHSLGPSPR